MTTEDKLNQCIDLTVQLWNAFKSIEESDLHQSDLPETCRDIHDIQNRIFSIANKNGIYIKTK